MHVNVTPKYLKNFSFLKSDVHRLYTNDRQTRSHDIYLNKILPYMCKYIGTPHLRL